MSEEEIKRILLTTGYTTQTDKDAIYLYIKELKEVIKEVRKYIESDPLVVVLDYDYYVNDLIQMEKCFTKMSFIGTLLQILDKVGD